MQNNLHSTADSYPGIKAYSLHGKKIIITGASSGIGRSCALVCASLGAELMLIGRDEEKLRYVSEEVSNFGGKHHFVSVDLHIPGTIKKAVSDYVGKHGPAHGFIHSAGIEQTMPLAFLKKDHFEEVFSVNFFAGIELSQIISKKDMFDPSGASFVFISSILSLASQSNTLFYAASKGALNSAMRTLALDLAAKKIRVNAILPSVVETDLIKTVFEKLPQDAVIKRRQDHPLGFGEPDDVAYACAYLLSDVAKWVTGTEFIIDGGFQCK